MALIPYYPLANGVLTGKYGRGRPLPTGSRLVDQIDEATRDRILSDRTFARLEALESYANDRGHSVLELAFAWLLAYPAVATVIAGVARPGQALTNANASGWQLGPDDADEIIGLVTAAT
jgi:aryl-alcohol dehydrogenase-like predicted oxidoreductase